MMDGIPRATGGFCGSERGSLGVEAGFQDERSVVWI